MTHYAIGFPKHDQAVSVPLHGVPKPKLMATIPMVKQLTARLLGKANVIYGFRLTEEGYAF